MLCIVLVDIHVPFHITFKLTCIVTLTWIDQWSNIHALHVDSFRFMIFFMLFHIFFKIIPSHEMIAKQLVYAFPCLFLPQVFNRYRHFFIRTLLCNLMTHSTGVEREYKQRDIVRINFSQCVMSTSMFYFKQLSNVWR